jgi:hypothetical protein
MPSEVPSRPARSRRRVWTLRLALVAGSTTVALLLVLGGLWAYARHLGIRDPEYLHEYQLAIFRPDHELGFRNVTNFSGYCFGTVHAQTNERGFRGPRPTALEKTPGTHRLIGLGDSVTWGAGVHREDTYLAKLESALNQSAPWEVINAGIVGYSTWQESIFLERELLAFQPDVVIVNYCENDLIATEDPFGRMQQIYLRHLESLRESTSPPLPEAERAALEALIEMMRAPRVKAAYDAAPDGVKEYAWELFVARPMRRMTEVSRAAGVRLIYVFIPPHLQRHWDQDRTRRWKDLLTGAGAEWLDVTPLLSGPDKIPPLTTADAFWQPPVRVRTLDNILLQRRIENVQGRNSFIDHVHPTRLGNEIIARQLHLFLTDQPLDPKVESHRRTKARRS